MKKVIIIGSGVAGATLANQLCGSFDVTVIEKGSKGDFYVPEKNYLARTFGSSPTYCIGEGGTSNLWHNGLIPINCEHLHDLEFKRIISDSTRYLDDSASSLNFKGKYSYELSERKSHYDKLFIKHNLVVDHDTILVPKANPKLHLDSKVSKFFEVDNFSVKYRDKNVESVSFTYSKSKLNTSIPCDYLIVCAGGIGTPPVLNQILGAYESHGKLIDHPMGFVGKIKVKKEHTELFKSLVNTDCGDMVSRCGLVIENNGYRHICYFRPAASMENDLTIYKFKSKLAASSWPERFKMIFSKNFFHPDIILEILMHLSGRQVGKSIFSLWFVFEQKPNQEVPYRVSNQEVDTISWNVNEKEIENYQESISILVEKISSMIDKSNVVSDNLADYLWSAAHHSGSVGIGKEHGQVDENLKLNDVGNVYVCDGSIINEHSYANTGLTIGQLAIRLSYHLQDISK
ncbi:hypothetical protein O1C66_003247 [Vibrio cholerae]|nr:hypothetical protein [Vibrio cholerae]